MKYARLGRSGLYVSRLCVGTMNFGSRYNDETASLPILDRALELGYNFFDTANGYGDPWRGGRTEKVLGNWMAQGDGRRDRVVLATKLYNPMNETGEGPEINRDNQSFSALKIIRECEASLVRLKTDRVDLLQMHHIDRNCPVDEYWEAIDTLQKQGKIIYAGSSNFAGWDIATYNTTAKARGKMGLISEQSVYNLTNRMVELEVIPSCRHHGAGLIPWSPLAGGCLGGVIKKSAKGGRRAANADDIDDALREKLTRYEDLCEELGEEPSNVALAWLLSNPVVSAAVTGPRTSKQLESALRALDVELSGEAMEKLDEIFPGPGGEAPAPYAW